MVLSDIKQAQRERLLHIDFRAYFLGDVGRSDLIKRFGIKAAAATRDLRIYSDLAPNNLNYDTKTRAFLRSKRFKPVFEYEESKVLAALSQGGGKGFTGSSAGMVSCETPAKLNKPKLDVLSVITRAIHQGKAVKVEYSSTSSGTTTRELVPFVLVDNGLRWHVRTFDRKNQRFGDFVITRITKVELLDALLQEHEDLKHDIQWNRIVEMELVPHPDNIEHPQVIELDYDMIDGVGKQNVRAAVAGYVLRRWNVDCSDDHGLRGGEYQLWLRNSPVLYGVENIAIAPNHKNPGNDSNNKTTGK
ncbi:MAG: WYL domain-containing protein [Gammaproteobacteria bacterium]|nr:WYL domain-containing protein [Gammaproteobacteria bacterium]